MTAMHVLPEITLDGIEVAKPLHLEAMTLMQCLDAPAQCQLIWRASTLEQSVQDKPGVANGARLTLRVEGQGSKLFTGEVSAVEHRCSPSGEWQLWVRAYDPLIALQRQQTLATQVDVSTAALLRTLAAAAGLEVGNVSESGPIWPRVIPRFRHDLALLRHYAARSGLHFYFADEAVHLVPIDGGGETARRLNLGEELVEARVEQNAVRPISQVTSVGWDSHTGAAHTATHKSSEQQGAPRHLLGAVLESEREAEALAEAHCSRQQQTAQVFWGIAEGDVTLRPGRHVQLGGFASNLCGPYWLSQAIHRVDAQGGYLVELSSRPETIERPEPQAGLVLGEVCDVDDPDQRGRVQVRLPSYHDAVSTWMLVLQLGAGGGKGLIALPEVGDQVAVMLPDGDPSQGVVLGGIYDAEGPPHEASAQGEAQHFPYTLASRGGQRIQLNDEEDSIRLQTSGGSYLALTPKGIVLHAEGDLTAEAPGRTFQLIADRIDMRRG